MLKKGTKFRTSDLKAELWKIRLNKSSSRTFFSMLQKSGFIEVNGKTIKIKKNIRL